MNIYETRLAVRWPDFDAIGHVNHGIYFTYLDEARDDVLRRTVGDFSTWPNVLVHVSIDYKQEVMLGTQEILVRSQIGKVGRTSVTFEQEVVAPQGGIAVACEAVLVAWDPTTRRARAITDKERGLLLSPLPS